MSVLSPRLAERLKLSVSLLSRLLVGLAFFAALGLQPALASRSASFSSPQAAFEQGMSALRAGQLDVALPALEHAASEGIFLAEFYLARIFADPTSGYTDHAKAYVLYQRLADQYADIDPDDDPRAPFVAKSFTALAGYLLRGVPELNVKPNPSRAAEYLHHAATFFNDHDAQFELAKLYLRDDDEPIKTRQALHWLSVLTEQGHAGAQAFLADLYWHGNHVEKSPLRAYALVTVAVENAPPHERIWIEDIHQNIYCGLSETVRTNAKGLIAFWRKQYGRTPEADRYGLSRLQIGPVRTCSNGEVVPVPGQTRSVVASEPTSKAATGDVATSALQTQKRPAGPTVAQGNPAGFGVRDAREVVTEQHN